MSKISEKVAYLDGLMEGLDIQDTKLKKLFSAIIDALDDIAEELSDQKDEIDELNEDLDDVCDCLEDYDEILFGDEDDEEDEDEEDEDEDDYFETVCPNCGETICFNEDALDANEGLICPNCGKTVDLVITVDEEEDN